MTGTSSTAERLGYVVREHDGAAQCGEAECGAIFHPRDAARVVEGSVLRGHRRRCPVRPEAVPIPGVCDS